MISDEKLADLERLEREAWRADWFHQPPNPEFSCHAVLATFGGEEEPSGPGYLLDFMDGGEQAGKDARFIAAIRNAAPDILRELRQLREVAKAARSYMEALDAWTENPCEVRSNDGRDAVAVLRNKVNDYFATDGGATK